MLSDQTAGVKPIPPRSPSPTSTPPIRQRVSTTARLPNRCGRSPRTRTRRKIAFDGSLTGGDALGVETAELVRTACALLHSAVALRREGRYVEAIDISRQATVLISQYAEVAERRLDQAG